MTLQRLPARPPPHFLLPFKSKRRYTLITPNAPRSLSTTRSLHDSASGSSSPTSGSSSGSSIGSGSSAGTVSGLGESPEGINRNLLRNLKKPTHNELCTNAQVGRCSRS